MSDIIARLRTQVKLETVGPQPFGQVVHHSPIIKRNLLLQRVTQQNDAAYLAPGIKFFERAGYLMSGNHPSPTETRKIVSTHMGSWSQPSLRLRVDAGSAMLREMGLNGLAG